MPDASTQTERNDAPASAAYKARGPVAGTTQKKYDQAIKRLVDAGLDLAEPKGVLTWIKSNYKDTVLKTYLSAIKNKWALDQGKTTHTNTKKTKSSDEEYVKKFYFIGDMPFPKLYQDEIDRLRQNQIDEDEKQELSEKQVSNFIPYEKLLAVQKKLAEKEDKSDVDWKDYLITSLYTLQPPVRADYADMKVFKKRGAKREGNELIWGQKSGAYFVFRDYKTHKTYGNVEVRVSPELHKVIDEYFNHLGKLPNHLLTGIAKDSDALLVAIGAAFFKKTQKHIGINLLRHAYIKHHYPQLESIAKKETLAKMMLHSREKQEHYNSQNV
jgi:hypothetical protein